MSHYISVKLNGIEWSRLECENIIYIGDEMDSNTVNSPYSTLDVTHFNVFHVIFQAGFLPVRKADIELNLLHCLLC